MLPAAVDAEELPSYVVDGGLFRVSRLDEAPAHEGPDEIVEEPASSTSSRWRTTEHDERARQHDDDEHDEDQDHQDDQAENPLEAPLVRSPEPPDWRPPPPRSPRSAATAAAVPARPTTPHRGDAPPLPRRRPNTTGSPSPDAWQPPPAEAPGIPGQPPAPDVTVPWLGS